MMILLRALSERVPQSAWYLENGLALHDFRAFFDVIVPVKCGQGFSFIDPIVDDGWVGVNGEAGAAASPEGAR